MQCRKERRKRDWMRRLTISPVLEGSATRTLLRHRPGEIRNGAWRLQAYAWYAKVDRRQLQREIISSQADAKLQFASPLNTHRSRLLVLPSLQTSFDVIYLLGTNGVCLISSFQHEYRSISSELFRRIAGTDPVPQRGKTELCLNPTF
jgi:hypothetical protein